MALVPIDDPKFVNAVISRCNAKNSYTHEDIEDAIREELELHPNITIDKDDFHCAVTDIWAECNRMGKPNETRS